MLRRFVRFRAVKSLDAHPVCVSRCGGQLLNTTSVSMAIVKRPLTTSAKGWQLVFDMGRKEFYVEDGKKRLSVDDAMKIDGEGAIELQSALVDLFKIQPSDARTPAG